MRNRRPRFIDYRGQRAGVAAASHALTMLLMPVMLLVWLLIRAPPVSAETPSPHQLIVSGTVRAVAPGWLTVEDGRGRRARLKMQSPDASGMLLADGRLIHFPCRLQIHGHVTAAALPIGSHLHCVAEVRRTRPACLAPVRRFRLQPPSRCGLKWPSAMSSRCDIVGQVALVDREAITIRFAESSSEPLLRLPITSDTVGLVRSDDPQWIRPGDRVRRLTARRLPTDEWAVESLDVELAGTDPRPLPPPRRPATPLLAAVRPHELRSAHLMLRTDLPASAAERLIGRMERLWGMLERHFGAASGRPVRCVVVRDVSRWNAAAFDATAWRQINQQAGVTITESVGQESAAMIFAAAREQVVLHEVVHAFCAQAFGDLGPTWYAEGLAEMGSHWRAASPLVQCDPVVTDFLRSQPARSLTSVLSERRGTGDSWRAYAWRWAACELLGRNPNYARRFADYGRHLMQRDDVSFPGFWGPQAEQASFEFRQLVRNIGVGYNHQLCAWDWTANFQELGAKDVLAVEVAARRGWQPSTLRVEAGRGYEHAGVGRWEVDEYRGPVSADGWPRGEGRLIASVLSRTASGWRLSPPWELGRRGAFLAPASGRLYLRSADDWTQLDDNRGQLTVHFRRAAALLSR